ncbi:MAG: methyltransferase domain-containing protein [bacterium]|nr:methyltransferase domain-containing protein [bacterium]
MKDYYSKSLSAERLVRVYELATPRIQRYLKAEVDTVISRIQPEHDVLELGCGYGRALISLVSHCRGLFGIDLSLPSLRMARRFCDSSGITSLAAMNVVNLAFEEESFDIVFGIQNGILLLGRTDQRWSGSRLEFWL